MTDPAAWRGSTMTGAVTGPELRGEVHQNLFVAQGSREVTALLTVDATQAAEPVAGPEVALRLWTPVVARIRLVERSAPETVHLTPRRIDVDPQVGLYPTGPWGPGRRDFRIAIDVPPADPGRTRIAARASFVRVAADGTVDPLAQRHTRRRPGGDVETRADAWISATWTDDSGAGTRAGTGRAEQMRHAETGKRIAETIRTAMSVMEAGADEEAEHLLRTARTWAGEIGDTDLVQRIDDMFDPETDTFRAGRVTRAEQQQLEIETTHRRVQRRPPG